MTSRFPALSRACGVIGPVCFVGGWATAGALRRDYSPLKEAISQLARVGAPNRWLMTSAFIGFGLTLPPFGKALQRDLAAHWPIRAAVSLVGLATLGVAAFPLSRSGGEEQDRLHEICAISGYVGTALAPILGGWALYRLGSHRAGIASMITGTVSAGLLIETGQATYVGFFQRSGLALVDIWFAVMAISLAHRPVSAPISGIGS